MSYDRTYKQRLQFYIKRDYMFLDPILSIPYMLSCFFAVVGGLTLAIYYSYDNPWLPQ